MNKKSKIKVFIFQLFFLSLLASTANGKGRNTSSSDFNIPSIPLPNLDFLLNKKEDTKGIQHAYSTNNQLHELDEIAKLAAEIQSDSTAYSVQPKVRFLHSLTKNTNDESKYIQDISIKLEKVGAVNFPTKLLRKSSEKRIIVAFTLDKRGKLLSSKVSKSSNIKKLDAEVLNIIKKASPYQPFSKNMKSKYDQINIVRTFLFR